MSVQKIYGGYFWPLSVIYIVVVAEKMDKAQTGWFQEIPHRLKNYTVTSGHGAGRDQIVK